MRLAIIIVPAVLLTLLQAASLDDPLYLPPAGTHALRILSPTVLELALITTKDPPPSRPAEWNFVAADGRLFAPAPGSFAVTADGISHTVRAVGFRRRPIYAAQRKRDLRIGNYLYLDLAAPISQGQAVEVKNPSGRVWSPESVFTAVAAPDRFSPAIHVNHQGYAPAFPKHAIVGYFIGSLGELAIPAGQGFTVVKHSTGEAVHQGILTHRNENGFRFSPAPYQNVYEADFTAVTNAGEYRLLVPGLGSSYPFRINEGAAAAFARTYALGLYHQRCGADNKLPFTRHVHASCHTAPAHIPTMAFTSVNRLLTNFTADVPKHPRHPAPRLINVAASLYPFVQSGKIDVSGGHHDAGDYSKYTINSAQLVHALVFTADNFPGAASLDNLGLPESGDGISDLLQEAKWEADFLAKMQDNDGGFYFLVYPRDRAYESDVLPENGDPQVVFPKNTAATAAATAALAQIASSPAFKAAYPVEAVALLERAMRGWEFLERAFARHGRDGAYQKISHYGDQFIHDDELAWAAAELFAATGEERFAAELISRFDPEDPAALADGWVRLWEGFGCAVRAYAFAARSGRRAPDELDPAYLAKCEAELRRAASDQVRYSRETAYGTSFPGIHKNNRTAGWFFSVPEAFDIAAATPLTGNPELLEVLLRNLNYAAGCNPLNVSFISGLGFKRQREMVHQYAANDRRILPPSGIPLGTVQRSFQDLPLYPAELIGLTFPHDYASSSPYAPFDIWADAYNLTTEFVNPQQARSLAVAAYLMTLTAAKDQPWQTAAAEIEFETPNVPAGEKVKARVRAPDLDLADAQIVWEGRGREPVLLAAHEPFELATQFIGRYWVEAEVLLPDGRRFAAVGEVRSTAPPTRIRVIGSSRIRVSGMPGQTFTLEGSNDLQSWIPLVTATIGTEPYDYFDEAGQELPFRFYRSLLLE